MKIKYNLTDGKRTVFLRSFRRINWFARGNRCSVFVLFWFAILCLNPQSASSSPVLQDKQDKGEKSSRREAAAVESIETAGGKVYKISAADESREISCYLSSNPIRDEHLKDINAIREVIWVNLAGTEITDDGLKYLVGLPLKKLHLERTQVGDDGLKHLKSFKDLEYLNLYGSKVTDAGLAHLAGLKNLKKLYVWQTGVTEAGMEKLNESLPELKIIGEVKLIPVVVEEPEEEKKEMEKKGSAEEDKKKVVAKEEEKKEEDKKDEDKKDDKKKSSEESKDKQASEDDKKGKPKKKKV